MSKPKRTPLAQAILLVMNLSDEDNATLRDVLRPERVVSKKVSKKKSNRQSPSAPPIVGMTEAGSVGPNCSICFQPAEHSDHDTRYINSHPFEPSKSAQSAGKRSSRKSAAKEPEASSGTSSDDAQVAAAGSNA